MFGIMQNIEPVNRSLQPYDALLNRIKANDPTLVALYFPDSYFDDNEGMPAEMARAIANNTVLAYLQIEVICTEEMITVANNRSIKNLVLSTTFCEPYGYIALAENTTLTSLTILYAGGFDGARDLQVSHEGLIALLKNKNLRHLHITGGPSDFVDPDAYDDDLSCDNALNNQIDQILVPLYENVNLISGSLTDLYSEYTRLTDAFTAVITRNLEIVEQRNSYIQAVMMIARDYVNKDYHASMFSQLPLELIMLILTKLALSYDHTLGKSPQQINSCIKFIFNNILELNELQQKKQAVKIMENTTSGSFRLFVEPKSVNTTALAMSSKNDSDVDNTNYDSNFCYQP